MESKKQFRSSRCHCMLIKHDVWRIVCTFVGKERCRQRVMDFESYSEALKEYNFLFNLTGGVAL